MIEVSVAVLVLGFVLAAAAAALITFVKAVGNNESDVRANQLVNETMERLRTAPWSAVAFSPSAVGYESAFDGQPTANLSAGAVQDPAILPLKTFKGADAGSPTYSVRTHVTWVDDCKNGGGSAASFDYKQLTVMVEWTERSVPNLVRADSYRMARSSEYLPATVSVAAC